MIETPDDHREQVEIGKKMFEEALLRAADRLGVPIETLDWAELPKAWTWFIRVSVGGKKQLGPLIPDEHLADAPASEEIVLWFDELATRWLRNPADRCYDPQRGPFADLALNR